MPFGAEPLVLSEEERRELQQMTQSRTLPAGDVMRSRMILLLADGVAYQKIQDLLDTTAPTIARWDDWSGTALNINGTVRCPSTLRWM